MLVFIFWADTLLMTEDRENDRWNRTKIEISWLWLIFQTDSLCHDDGKGKDNPHFNTSWCYILDGLFSFRIDKIWLEYLNIENKFVWFFLVFPKLRELQLSCFEFEFLKSAFLNSGHPSLSEYSLVASASCLLSPCPTAIPVPRECFRIVSILLLHKLHKLMLTKWILPQR